jgi:HD-GYP domain-containing protein (c-di-GMP phosphodiesterase class II)
MDFSKAGLMNHHQRVALLSLKIAEAMDIPKENLQRLFCAAIIHDAGTSTWQEKAELEVFDINNPWDHCARGYKLLNSMSILSPVAHIILCHHDRWEGNNPSELAGRDIPIESRIIHIADRIDILAGKTNNILNDRYDIIDHISGYANILFDPQVVQAFTEIAHKESLWLDLNSRFIGQLLKTNMGGCEVSMSHRELLQVSEMFARVIDGKSPFAHRHSRLVSQIAFYLAGKMGFNQKEIQDMEVAGLLHDLGKLTVPDEILEKPGKLSQYEFNIMKQHTYYTFQILNLIDGFESINQWASFHHEKLNGTGYPFHLNAKDLCTGSRIMSVSDIYSALVENRPYRRGLERDDIFKILDNQVKEGAIDKEIVMLLRENIDGAEAIAENLKLTGQAIDA